MALFLKRLFKLNSVSLQHCEKFIKGTRNIVNGKTFKAKPVKRHKNFPLYENVNLDLPPKLDKRPKQKFNHFLVLDFEATCDSPANLDPQEIIEFPVLKVNSDTFQIESMFHSYVKPEIYPYLTPFCTELTGIIQSMVENQPVFKEVFEEFQNWLQKENILYPDNKFAFVTCGDPDFDYLLPVQCYFSNIPVPDYMKQWINVKRSFCEISPYKWPNNLIAMLKKCGLEHTGDLHSGLDDAKNVVSVMADLADRGLVFDINGWKDDDDLSFKNNRTTRMNRFDKKRFLKYFI